jgi:hypothetical protein
MSFAAWVYFCILADCLRSVALGFAAGYYMG